MLTSLWNDVIMNKTDGGECMNIIHMKYAVEVARIGSINKAAEELLIAQPNLSRSIKELEADLGITIFSRTSKGMNLTPEGEEFIGYARKILDQIDDVERIYRQGVPKKQKFSISVPRASYISEAFADFSRTITGDSAELFYYETNAHRAIDNIFDSNYSLGIIRYASVYDKYFKRSLEEKGLEYELIAEFSYMLVASRESSIASLDEVHFGNLTNMIEIAHADPYVPSLPLSNVKKEELLDSIGRRIFLFERGSQLIFYL
jgi:DNA-binding transcriptional LysR family regulator